MGIQSRRLIFSESINMNELSLTADNEPYNQEQVYYYYDQRTKSVRSTEGLDRTGPIALGSEGLALVLINILHSNRDDALAEGQKELLAEMHQLADLVEEFESYKTPKERSL